MLEFPSSPQLIPNIPAPPTRYNDIRAMGQRLPQFFPHLATAKMAMKTFLPPFLVPIRVHIKVQLDGADCGETKRVKLFPDRLGGRRVISQSLAHPERKAGPC